MGDGHLGSASTPSKSSPSGGAYGIVGGMWREVVGELLDLFTLETG